jgi:hypothetical protein
MGGIGGHDGTPGAAGAPSDASARGLDAAASPRGRSLQRTRAPSQRRYVCSWPGCGKACRSPSELVPHERVHSGVRDACRKCGREFAHTANLKAHERACVNGEPPRYACPHCPARFPHPTTCRDHVANLHEGIKPYKCPHCSESCVSSSNVKRHILRRHADVAAAESARRQAAALAGAADEALAAPAGVATGRGTHPGRRTGRGGERGWGVGLSRAGRAAGQFVGSAALAAPAGGSASLEEAAAAVAAAGAASASAVQAGLAPDASLDSRGFFPAPFELPSHGAAAAPHAPPRAGLLGALSDPELWPLPFPGGELLVLPPLPEPSYRALPAAASLAAALSVSMSTPAASPATWGDTVTAAKGSGVTAEAAAAIADARGPAAGSGASASSTGVGAEATHGDLFL